VEGAPESQVDRCDGNPGEERGDAGEVYEPEGI
jgi:hypothetical protein